jgi:glycosyltransferase involved in cell wall biosynthesis
VRILFVANDPPGHAVHRYRCANLAEILQRAGHVADVAYIGQARVRVCHDVVVLHRICTTLEGRWFASAARACGAVLVYSTDDLVFDRDLLAADPEVPRRYIACAPLHRAMLDQSDAALVSTEYLRSQVCRAAPTKPVYLLRNFLTPDLLARSETARHEATSEGERGGAVTLGYLSGSATHDRDLASIAPVLGSLLDAYPGVRLLLVGPVRTPAELATLEAAGRVDRHPFLPWQCLPYLLANRVDINLAPLDPSRDFNQAKSEVKLLEAAAVSLPTIASRSAGFAEVAASMPALYAADADDWQALLRWLLDNPAERRALGERARMALDGFGTADAVSGGIHAAFDQIATLPHPVMASAPRLHWVNWPVAPRYAVRDAVFRAVDHLHRLVGRV